MTSGWDKNPGPDNDYTPNVSAWGWIGTAVFMVALMGGVLWLALR